MSLVVREIALDSLYISPYNVRRDQGDLTELIDSIRDRGVLEPILVWQKGEQYEVIAGSRRVAAARQAGHTTIPASLLELTDDVQAILTSVTENIQRKNLTLEERVKTYQVLQQLDPDYRSHRSLAKVIRLSHRKIGEDFQAYEIALKLQPHGISVESHFPRTAPERQRGDVLPEHHAVMLHQASSSLRAKAAVPDDVFDADLARLAREIAPHSQDEAKEILALMQSAVDSMDKLVGQQEKPDQCSLSQGTSTPATGCEEAGFITCSCCGRVLQLIHRADDTHTVTDTSLTGHPVLPPLAFPDEPIAAALSPAPAASVPPPTSDSPSAPEDSETPHHGE